ncbi:hypothetical protein GCM10023185_37320 [Hymenobacter saemangeumensis]|uniref:IS3 family transposase n=1 Tax=Hymenobacter saemangeumensis TaxID=1084522 RepID=A0ABP8IQN5_9BACT
MAEQAVAAGLSQRRACALVGLARRCYTARPASRRPAADAPVLAGLRALVERHPG